MTELFNEMLILEKGDRLLDINCKKCQVFGLMACNMCIEKHHCGYCDSVFNDNTLVPADNEIWSLEDDITYTANDVGKEKYAKRACQRCFDESITVLKFTD